MTEQRRARQPRISGTLSRPAEAEVALPQAQRGAERSEEGDEHSKSCAVHQDKRGAGFPWYESSKENLTMACAEPSEE